MARLDQKRVETSAVRHKLPLQDVKTFLIQGLEERPHSRLLAVQHQAAVAGHVACQVDAIGAVGPVVVTQAQEYLRRLDTL
ncbi:MAG: hypothetical protein F4X98_04095 [Gammaproteobacteria bacterium]|nr:hypothetical protein [Gammaproteobacteria bacterium]